MQAKDLEASNGVESPVSARWVRNHWWSNHHFLKCAGRTIATVHVNGSIGVAWVGDIKYVLERLRLPPYVTIRDAQSDDLVVRFCLMPAKGGLLAEFDDGESFRFGWTHFWKAEWAWTDDTGATVLLFKRSRFMKVVFPRRYRDKWPLLAILELAMAELARPWF